MRVKTQDVFEVSAECPDQSNTCGIIFECRLIRLNDRRGMGWIATREGHVVVQALFLWLGEKAIGSFERGQLAIAPRHADEVHHFTRRQPRRTLHDGDHACEYRRCPNVAKAGFPPVHVVNFVGVDHLALQDGSIARGLAGDAEYGFGLIVLSAVDGAHVRLDGEARHGRDAE